MTEDEFVAARNFQRVVLLEYILDQMEDVDPDDRIDMQRITKRWRADTLSRCKIHDDGKAPTP